MGIAAPLLTAFVLAGSVAHAATPAFRPVAADPLATLTTGATKADRPAVPARFDDGTLLVRFRPGAAAAARAGVLDRLELRSRGRVRGTRFELVATPDDDVRRTARSLRAAPAVADVELNYERRATAVPNDPLYAKGAQGYLDTLRLPAAWDLQKASTSHVVAILDTGVDSDHPDLAAQLVAGRDVVHGDGWAEDDQGHGTMVAGIAAGRADDGAGVAGVAWRGAIMPVKVLDNEGSGWDADVATGITWAADHGADVINLSLGGAGASDVLEEAVAHARAQGSVVVAAAGNDSSPERHYPAATDGVLAVAATDWSGDLAYFSNHGAWIDLAAPGMGLTSSTRAGDGGAWTPHLDGTSFSSPVVAGAALLVHAQNPTWTPAQIEARLLASALDAGPAGTDAFYGRGVVDPTAALGGAATPRTSPPPSDGDSTMDKARVVTSNAAMTSTIAYEGDADWYAIDVPAAGSVGASVMPSNPDGMDGRRLDAIIEIYDSTGRLRRVGDSYFEDRPESVTADVPAPGRWYVRVANYAGSRHAGTYQVSVAASTDRQLRRFRYRPRNLPYWASSSEIGDVTGDGHGDVLVTQEESTSGKLYDQLYVYPGDGDGGLGAPAIYDLGARAMWTTALGTLWAEEMDVTLGDLDGDGDTDAAVAVGRWVGVLYQRDGGFAPVAPVPGSVGARQVEVADMDADGRQDLVARHDGIDSQGASVRGIALYRNTTTGFTRQLLTSEYSFDLALGDVNGNGRRDVASVTGGLSLIRQHSDGSWSAPTTVAGSVPVSIEVADVSGDGRADLITGEGSYDEHDVVVRPQTSTGGVGAPARYDAPADVVATEAADVNGDGRRDVVTVHDGAMRGGFLLQRGDGTLGAEEWFDLGYATRYKPSALAVGNLTGDAGADLAVADYSDQDDGGELMVLLQETADWPRATWLRDSTPVTSQRGVSATVAPVLRFARTLAPASITDASVRLERADTGAAIAATRTWSATNRTITLQPVSALVAGASYRIVVDGIRDAQGYAPAEPIHVHFTVAGGTAVDTTAPDTRFRSGPVGAVSTQDPMFHVYASEPGTRLQCSVENAAFTDCAPLIQPHVLSGTRNLRVRAIDSAGNVDPTPASRTWSGRTDAAYPPNDQRADAQALTGASGSVSGTNAYATFHRVHDADREGVQITGASPGGQDVWYRWTAPQSGFVTFETSGASFDTLLGAFDETVRSRRVGHNDDVSATSTASRVTFYVRAGRQYSIGVDGFGNELYAATGTFTLGWSMSGAADTTPPDTVVDDAPAGLVGRSLFTFTFHATEAGSTFECQRGFDPPDAWVACASPQVWPVGNGANTIRIRAIDRAGNVDPTPAVRTWQAAAFAPDTMIDSSSVAGETHATEATFAFHGTETATRFQCRLDRGAWSACTSPHTYRGLAVGPHEIDVRAIDGAGHADNTPSRGWWTVLEGPGDVTPPDTTIVGGPTGTTSSRTATFRWSSNEPQAHAQCRLDGAAWTDCGDEITYSGLADGQHVFEARAHDPAGNIDPTPASRTWTVDTTAPDTSITSGPSGTVASTSASFSFTSSESGASFECRLDTGAWASCSSPRSLSGLADGAHTFEVRARDAAQNVDATPASRTWTVDTPDPDTTPPTTEIESGPPALTNSSGATLTFSSNEPGATFECRLGGAWGACSSPKTYASLADGLHTFEVRARDAAGNVDATPASREWRSDTRAPETRIDAGPTAPDGSFAFAADEEGATFACRMDAGAWTPCSSPHAPAAVAAGDHVFAVRATDAAGNADATPAERAFTVAGDPPVKPGTGDAGGTGDPAGGTDPGAGDSGRTGETDRTGGDTGRTGGSDASRSGVAPQARALAVAPRRLRPARRGGSVVRRGGALVSFYLDRRAELVVRVERMTRRGPVALPGSFGVAALQGANRFRFSGRLAGRRLPKGRYRLRLTTSTATDALPATAFTPVFRVA
jgi:hypothetical protein